MLRFDQIIFLFLILAIMDNNMPPVIANVLSFLAGISLKTIPDLIKGQISRPDLGVRLSKIFGLVVIFLLLKDWFSVTQRGVIVYIFMVTLFSELIVYLLMKHGKRWLEKKANDLENE